MAKWATIFASNFRLGNELILRFVASGIVVFVVLFLHIRGGTFLEQNIPFNSHAPLHPCLSKYVYSYPLPPQFNSLVIQKLCLDGAWMCHYLQNHGLGKAFQTNDSKLVPSDAWFQTEQFTLEYQFHERIKQYSCLTDDPERADLFYIPYYAGIDIGNYLFSDQLQMRDKLSQRLVGWLQSQPYLSRRQGRDHFMILGRIVWDFGRQEHTQGWGAALLSIPELKNVSKLLLERNTWDENQFAVPYPTAFHPSSSDQVELWQESLSRFPRDSLVSYSGAPRWGNGSVARLRNILQEQCESHQNCTMLRCDQVNCIKRPELVTGLYLRSVFCLMPPGDSPTRKAIFDSMIAGCIPVLFSEHSSYTQYLWHLPSNATSYSVFYPFDHFLHSHPHPNIVQFLAAIPLPSVKSLQETIVHILPHIVYAKPGYKKSDPKFMDAFDIILENAIKRASSFSSSSSSSSLDSLAVQGS